jgi:hypothetical protein
MPVEGFGQDAAGEKADRRAGRGHEAVEADRPGPFAWLGEHRHDHPEDDGRGHRAAQALDEPGSDQRLAAGADPARQGGEREDRQAREEDASATEEVAEAAGQQKNAAEGDEVGVHDPGQA